MTQAYFDENYKGQQFECQIDTSILYTSKLVEAKGQTVKKGDIVTVSDFFKYKRQISIETMETIHRIDRTFFDAYFKKISQ